MFTTTHGPLDNFSFFQYENYLQEIKKTVKYAKYPLQEISNRIKEKQIINNQHTNHINNESPNPFFNITAQLYQKSILN